MDNPKYMKQNHKLQTTKSKTRTIGVNTEENYPKCNCHKTEDICPRFIFVPCLPYYPMCTNTVNQCCTPNFNINPNILNQYQFVHNGNEMKQYNNCEKHNFASNLLHCCSSSNCTCTSSTNGINQKMMNTVEVNQNEPNAPVKKNSRENELRKTSLDKINIIINEKKHGNIFPPESFENNSYYEATNENGKQYCDEEITRYATELLDSQNYKMAQEYDEEKIGNNNEKKMMNHLLTPTQRKFSNIMTNAVEDSDECLEDEYSETSSIDEDLPITKANEEEERKRPSTADGGARNNFNSFKKLSKPNEGMSSDLEMLMMLKAFVSQNSDKDVNPKLNQLLNHLSSQETSIRPDSQMDNKKSLIPRK